MIHSKIHNLCLIEQIFTGCKEQAGRYSQVKYLSNQMILKFLHKFDIITKILEF